MRQFIVCCAAAALMWPGLAEAAEPSAKEMAQRVADTLRESGELSNYRVGVKYQDGVAWLLGSVTSKEQANTASRLTGKIAGINRVINKLEVTGGQSDDDIMLSMLEQKAPKELAPAPATRPAEPAQQIEQVSRLAPRGMPRPIRQAGLHQPRPVQAAGYGGMPSPQGYSTGGAAGVSYDAANMPNYAWPSYAAHPNYSALSYPKQYSPSAWPYIGPFYPYPQVPLGWRKVTLEWDDGWWFLDFSHHKGH